jgi:uncharacterized spore protein YtfJ
MRTRMFLVFLTAVVLVSSGQLQAQDKTSIDEAFASYDKMMSVINVNSVIGKPIRSGNVIVVPFSKISIGFGAGGMMMGYGGGMGGKVVPLGILVIEGNDVRIEVFPLEEKRPSFLEQMLPVLLKALPQFLGKKGASPPSATPTEIPEGAGEVGEASLGRVEELYSDKMYPQALEMIESLLAKDPNNADLHTWKGNIMGTMAQGNPMDMMKYGMGAMQAFETALQLDPNHASAHFGRGMGRLMAPQGFGGDLDGAIQDFKFACEKSHSEACYYLGEAYTKKGLKEEAKKAYEQVLKLTPNHEGAAEALKKIRQ